MERPQAARRRQAVPQRGRTNFCSALMMQERRRAELKELPAADAAGKLPRRRRAAGGALEMPEDSGSVVGPGVDVGFSFDELKELELSS